jgi:hypothetical protein
MNLPTISSYGQYSSSNYGAHCLRLDFGPITVWYSYDTPVAFHIDGQNRVVRKNDWNRTTGKHLRWIDGHLSKDKNSGRVDGSTFENLWVQHVAPLFADKPAPEPGIMDGVGPLLH